MLDFLHVSSIVLNVILIPLARWVYSVEKRLTKIETKIDDLKNES